MTDSEMNSSRCSDWSVRTVVPIFSHTLPGPYVLSRPVSVCKQVMFAAGTEH